MAVADCENLRKIAESAEKISAQSIYDGPLFTALTGALFAAIAAFVLNYLHWFLTKRKDNVCALAANIKMVVSNLTDISVSHWLEPVSKRTAEVVAQECKIKTLSRLQISYYNLLKELLRNRGVFNSFIASRIFYRLNKFIFFGIFNKHIQQINTLDNKLKSIHEDMGKLFDLVSGGSFGAVSRSSEPVRASKISSVSAQLDVQLCEIVFGNGY